MVNIENIISRFVIAARGRGWTVRYRDRTAVKLNDKLKSRYYKIPSEYLQFLSLIDKCVNQAQDAWFFCASDYNQTVVENTWLCDSYEKIMLESLEADGFSTKEVTKFWNRHLPIAYAVHSDMAYLALSVSQKDYGKVIYGYGPEFNESSWAICESFSEYLENLTKILLEEVGYEKTDQRGHKYIEREYSDFV